MKLFCNNNQKKNKMQNKSHEPEPKTCTLHVIKYKILYVCESVMQSGESSFVPDVL